MFEIQLLNQVYRGNAQEQLQLCKRLMPMRSEDCIDAAAEHIGRSQATTTFHQTIMLSHTDTVHEKLSLHQANSVV